MGGALDNWGEQAGVLLRQITGQHCRRKRATLLALADGAYAGTSLNEALTGPETGSKTAHYKWLRNDPDYAAAYMHLVGHDDAPGLALRQRQAELDAIEAAAVAAVTEARRTLRLASLDAVRALRDALQATVVFQGADTDAADHRARVAASKEILDRIEDTAPQMGMDVPGLTRLLDAVWGEDAGTNSDGGGGE